MSGLAGDMPQGIEGLPSDESSAQMAMTMGNAGLGGVDAQSVAALEQRLAPSTKQRVQTLAATILAHVMSAAEAQHASLLPSAHARESSRARATSGHLDAQVQAHWVVLVSAGHINDMHDVKVLIRLVLRESYLQSSDELRQHALKLKRLHEHKKAIRDGLVGLQAFQVNVEPDAQPASAAARQLQLQAMVAQANALATVNSGAKQLCSNTAQAFFLSELAAIEHMQNMLIAVGDDVKRANMTLQAMLQRQQQVLQSLADVSKLLSETGLAIIRKRSL